MSWPRLAGQADHIINIRFFSRAMVYSGLGHQLAYQKGGSAILTPVYEVDLIVLRTVRMP